MNIVEHIVNGIRIAEWIGDEVIITCVEDSTDLLGNIYYQGYDALILHEQNFSSAFFTRKSGLAGEVLHKFSNYSIRLAIVGDFTRYSSKSLSQFMYESNSGRNILFVPSKDKAISGISGSEAG